MEKCPKCSKFRKIDAHLFELASFCTVLDNVADFKDEEEDALVSTVTIGEWLKLAAQLDNVVIDTWKFTDGAEFFCETVADACDSDTKHYSAYSTALTKFIFVSNALEEMYRFISPHYLSSDKVKNRKLRKPSMQATALVDIYEEDDFPLYFKHKVENFIEAFNCCDYIKDKPLGGMKNVKLEDNSYALHLIRNIRNYVAHGVFPISENPEWTSDYLAHQALYEVLLSSCRLACLYIQVFLNKYNTGMQSDDYRLTMKGVGSEFDYFRENCTPDLALKVHLSDTFSFLD
ncbi:hypothetical protein ABVD54_005039 [Vibrio parahaemolyticus]|nr:hypothetical protein [Vibrio parahaemolyticus]MDF4735538.1 hypothetical protein [Vibrio parahaemolyticus]MDG2608644.1 hypothetical protein [Vibrio parahaemolyticus]